MQIAGVGGAEEYNLLSVNTIFTEAEVLVNQCGPFLCQLFFLLHINNPNLTLVSIWHPADFIIWNQGDFIHLFSDINNNCGTQYDLNHYTFSGYAIPTTYSVSFLLSLDFVTEAVR